MDSTLPSPWSQERYFSIEHTMKTLLIQELQFPERSVRCVPVSGLGGENLVRVSETCGLKAWYEGPTLAEAMDTFSLPPRPVDKPFRARAVEADEVNTIGRNNSNTHNIFSAIVLQGRIAVGRTVGVAKCSAGRIQLSSAKVLAVSDDYSNCLSTVQKKTTNVKNLAIAKEKVFIALSGSK
jgi:translation elongation factor EF-1alpha